MSLCKGDVDHDLIWPGDGINGTDSWWSIIDYPPCKNPNLRKREIHARFWTWWFFPNNLFLYISAVFFTVVVVFHPTQVTAEAENCGRIRW